MFKSLIVTAVLFLSPVFGAAWACPLEQQSSSDDRAAACGASLIRVLPSQNIATIFATSSTRGAATEVSTSWSHVAEDGHFALYYLRDYLRLERLASTGWERLIPTPRPIALNAADPSTNPSLAWRQEAEELSRRDSVGYLNLQSVNLQSVEAAAFARLPQPLGVAAAYNALKRQDDETWRRFGASGVKRGWELEYAPFQNTLIYLKDSYSSASQRTLAEAKLGIAVFEPSALGCGTLGKVYVGPFAVADGLRRDQVGKVGAHLTLSEIGAFHLTLASGIDHERSRGRGAFGLIETSWRF
jgi:hypothetical protein